MAKKKSKNKSKGQQQPALSPYRFMREKTRTLPISKCYIAPPDWLESGMAHVIVTRVRPSGNLVMASFLVDTFCLGVKDAGYHENMTPYDFEQYLDNYKNGMGLEEISYNEAHNIIYGAMAFAEECGIKPSDVKKALDGMLKMKEESRRYPDEKYTYQYPDYPQTLSVKNQFIADELLSPDNYSCLPCEVIDRILALPKDEAAQDISNVILYSIGKTYKGINDDTIENWNNSAIMHSVILLAQLQSDKGLGAVLEIMRQNGEFADYHLGDFAPELLHPALYACGKDNIPAIEAYLNQPGLDSYLRSQAPDALAMIIFNQPERRGEIIELFRQLLINMISNLPTQKACDGTFAGFVMSNLMDIDAKELIPEIKATFATDCVNKTIAGDCKNVIKDIELGRGAIHNEKYQIPDIYEQYESLKKFITKPE